VTKSLFAALAACVCALSTPSAATADVTWPEDQLLPSFPAPESTQDLIFLRGASFTWEAEGSAFMHGTGHLDGDGWLCQTGKDEPNKHMIYGPYDASLPAGGNTAHFRMKIDDNTADDARQVTIDVRDATTGDVLASKDITRKQFTVAGDWVDFALPFKIPALGHSIEMRVYWTGAAYIKVDSIRVDRGSEDELVLFASLKGVVNKQKPRIFSYEGDALAEGEHAWLESLGLKWQDQPDKWALLTKYKSEIKGLVVWDPTVPDTMNVATTIAGPKSALVASPALLKRLTEAPYNFTILEDLRGRFANKLAVYQYVYDNLWPKLTHRLLFGLSPDSHKAAVREYASALGAAVIWLNPQTSGESEMLDKFLSSMTPGGAFMGWWPDEGPGVERASRHGIATVASDYATNLTMHSGMPRKVHTKPIPPKPVLQNKMYVAFILSDGDNLQYVEHLMRKLWKDQARGQVPMGWTVSPAMLDAMPGALDYYYTSGTDNDNLISGPSGWGYGYPNFWKSDDLLAKYLNTTDDYARRAGLRVVTVWNTITGAIDDDVGRAYANHASSLLGVTAQDTGHGLTVYDGKFPGFALTCNYCTNEQAIKDHIGHGSDNWDHNSPRFILIQAQPWQGVTPSTFRNVKNSLNGDYVVVRPDNWFQLLRQANHLPIEPIKPVSEGVYRLVNKASQKCMAVASVESGTAVQQVACADDDTQRWRVTATDSGYVKISALSDESLVLNIDGDATKDGAKLTLAKDPQSDQDQWQPVWEAGKDYHVLARQGDHCLDVPSGTSDDAQLQQWTCNGATAQAFQFADPVWPPPMEEPDAGVGNPDGGVSGDGDGDTGDGDTGDGDGDTGDGDDGDGDDGDGDTGDGDDGDGDHGDGDGDAHGDGDGNSDGIPHTQPGGCSAASGMDTSAAELFGLGLLLLLGRLRRARRRRAA
jgi:hypothetical protein